MDLSDADRALLAALRGEFTKENDKKRWRSDPVAWVTERLGEHVWSRQADILNAVRDHKLVAVQSSHGVGKSFLVARIVAFYLDNYPPGDFFVVTSAPTAAQVRGVLWRYIGQLHKEHKLPGRVTQSAEWKIDNELVAFGRKPADTDEQGMQGIHARRGVVVIIDEGSGVPDQIFNAADSLATTRESRIVVIGNPDSMSSRFYKICTSEPGWHRMKINSFDTPAWTGEHVPDEVKDLETGTIRGLVDHSYVEDKAARWGVKSALYKIKVLGEFAEEDDRAVIPRSWVIAANNRWRDTEDDPEAGPTGRTVISVDVGGQGEDKTVIAIRKGDRVLHVESWSRRDTVQIVELVRQFASEWVRPTVIVDGNGIGIGVVDQLRHYSNLSVISFVAQRATKARDITGEMRFVDWRAAAWWHLRELLNPAHDARLALPPDDDLMNDLIVPRYQVVAGGKIRIESKDDIRKRLGRSTDYGDSVMQALFVERYQREFQATEERRNSIGRLRAVDYVDATGWQYD